MFEKHTVFLLFLAFAFASQELQLGIETDACDYHSVHMDCGSECSPSGSCDFDVCRLCCEQRTCPNYFETLCGESPEGVLYVGGNAKPLLLSGGHCEADGYGVLNACHTDEICTQ